MANYVKKPVVVEAVQFTEDMDAGRNPLPAGVVKRQTCSRPPPPGLGLLVYALFLVQTSHGERAVHVGDWLVTSPSVYVWPARGVRRRLREGAGSRLTH